MEKQLPYFKFKVLDWINGDISLEDYSIQGIFINLCCYYWSKKCDLTSSQATKKYKDIQPLIDAGIVKISGDRLKILFLDEQFLEWQNLSKTNSKNGKKGGRPKAKQNPIKSDRKATASIPLSETKANQSNKDISSIKEDIEKTTSTTLFSLYEFENLIELSENEFTLFATRQTKKSIPELVEYKGQFIFDCRATGKLSWPNIRDAKQHFINWVKKQPEVIIQRHRFLPGN